MTSIKSGSASISGESHVSETSSLQWLRRTTVTELEVFLFVMAMILGSQFTSWNKVIDQGYWLNFTDLLLVGSCFLSLSLCMSEMSSALPFSGGIYGFVRATIGPFSGYIVATFEILLNMSYVSVVVYSIGSIPISLQQASTSFQVGLICIVYGAIAIICIFGGKLFWAMSSLLGAIIITLVAIYLIGTLSDVDHQVNFQTYCNNIPSTFTFTDLFSNFHIAAGAYVGFQYIPLFSDVLPSPKTQVPRLMIGGMLLLIFTAISLLSASCSQFPGAKYLASAGTPFMYGFAKIFGTSIDDGVWLNFPALFGSSFAFLYCSGKQLYSISQSQLIPSIFTAKLPIIGTPYVGFLFLALICGGLSIAGVYNADIITLLNYIAQLSAQLVFLFLPISYLFFRYNLSGLKREFTNPFGIGAAIYAIIIDVVLFISMFFRSKDVDLALGICGAYLVWGVLFYIFYRGNHQGFSAEEKELMFKAYLINANHANRHKGKHHAHPPHRTGVVSSVLAHNKVVPHNPSSHPHTIAHKTAATPLALTSPAKADETSTHHSSGKQQMISAVEPVVQDLEAGKSQPEPIHTSEKVSVLAYVSEKIQQVVRASMDASQMKEYQQMAILATGGEMKDPEQQVELEEEVFHFSSRQARPNDDNELHQPDGLLDQPDEESKK